MRRVCKRWDAAVFAEPSFWKEFILAPPRRIKTPAGQQSWLLLKLAQLRRIGAWVRAFKVLNWSILEAEVISSRSKRPTFTSFLEVLFTWGFGGHACCAANCGCGRTAEGGGAAASAGPG